MKKRTVNKRDHYPLLDDANCNRSLISLIFIFLYLLCSVIFAKIVKFVKLMIFFGIIGVGLTYIKYSFTFFCFFFLNFGWP